MKENFFLYLLIIILFNINNVNLAVNVTKEGFLFNNFELSHDRQDFDISITFRTKKHHGLLFYGTDEDSFLTLELYYGSVRISGNFSLQISEMPFTGYAGYGLADGYPHQVELFKGSYTLGIIIDRGTDKLQSFIISSSFLHDSRNFDKIYLANHPNIKIFNNFQSITKTNFVGCIEEAKWNAIDILHKPYFEDSYPICNLPNIHNPITFLRMDSFIMMYRDKNISGFDLAFDILIYQNFTTILKHVQNETILTLKIIEGRLQMTLTYNGNVIINALNPLNIISDGVWHHVHMKIPGSASTYKNVLFIVDKYKIDSPSPIYYTANRDIQFGGYGFIGCIENIKLDGISYNLEKHYKRRGISTTGCNITFQCNPNPCVNAGICIALEGLEYKCSCNKNMTGLNCELPIAPPTCSEIHKLGFRRNGPNIIDVDDIGLFDPVWILCFHMDTFDSNKTTTYVAPEIETYDLIDFPKSWDIKYNVSTHLLHLLTEHSAHCKQAVLYQCTKSKITEGNITLMNWVGGDNQVHEYWNKFGIYGKCQCSIGQNTCVNNKNCNCDNYDTVARTDLTDLSVKEHLPIVKINAMNISSLQGSSAKLTVGPLICNGFGGKTQSVTFKEVYTYMPAPALNLWNAGSFQLEFRTDQARGNIILYSRGRVGIDYILLYLKNPTILSVQVNLGTITHEINVDVSSKTINFEDNNYHTVKFTISRRKFKLEVNELYAEKALNNSIFAGILLNLDNLPTYIGGTPFDPFSGFRGTIRDYKNNGRPINLKQLAINESLVGVIPGPFSACIAVINPCNFGRCVEHYNYYECDCSYSPYYGSNCQEEKGISVKYGDYAILYTFNEDITLINMHFAIGFSTTQKSATLFAIQSKYSEVYLITNINNGALNIYYNFRVNVTEEVRSFLISKDKISPNLSDGKLHTIKVYIFYENLYVTIDTQIFMKQIEEFTKTPTVFSSPESFYIGGAIFSGFITNDELGFKSYPFIGCISGIKMVYKRVGWPNSIKIDPMDLYYIRSKEIQTGTILESKCGNVNLTIKPNAPLIPYPPNPVAGDISSVKRRLPLGESWGPTLLGFFVFLFILLLLIILFLLKWWSRNKATYRTEEGNKSKTGNIIGYYNPNESLLSENNYINANIENVYNNNTGYI